MSDYKEEDFVQPAQGGLSGAAQVPTAENDKTKNPNKVLLTPGLNPGRIVEIVDIGSHMQSFQGKNPERKRMIRVCFEHPHLKQKYYLEDDAPSSAITSKETTYIISEKSFLKKLIDTCEGRITSDDEAKSLARDMNKYLGRVIGINIQHKTAKAGHVYEKIDGISSWNDQTMKMPEPWAPERPLCWFFVDQDASGGTIGQNFLSQVFANMPYYTRSRLLDSFEAKEYKARGGKFAAKPEANSAQTNAVNNANAGGTQTPNAPLEKKGTPMPENPDGTHVLEMIDKEYSYDDYLANQWSTAQMVSEGKAKWVPKPMAPKPLGGPGGPSAPSAGLGQPQQMQQQPQQTIQAPPVTQQQQQPQQSFQQFQQQQGADSGNDDLPF